jgi:hypothetical protein
MSDFNLTDFLTAYGYIKPAEIADPGAIEDAITTAQHVYGLPETGEADPMTVRVLGRTPRCGRPDVEEHRIGIPHWAARKLTWALSAYPVGSGLTKAQVDTAFNAAFANWAAVCGLTFERIESGAAITMGVGRGNRAGFDGPSGVLAWMELPPQEDFAGKLNGLFDQDEPWAIEGRGILLINVACHEIGHALGLVHSRRSDQLMSPTYSSRVPAPLTEDVTRIQAIYGPSTLPPPDPKPGSMSPAKTQVLMSDNSVYEFSNPKKLR